jgi:hypothetical protein
MLKPGYFSAREMLGLRNDPHDWRGVIPLLVAMPTGSCSEFSARRLGQSQGADVSPSLSLYAKADRRKRQARRVTHLLDCPCRSMLTQVLPL